MNIFLCNNNIKNNFLILEIIPIYYILKIYHNTLYQDIQKPDKIKKHFFRKIK